MILFCRSYVSLKRIIIGTLCLFLSIVFIFGLSLLSFNSVSYAANMNIEKDVSVPVYCSSGDENFIYKIKIESNSKDAPMPLNDTLVLNKVGTGSFNIKVTEPGTFRYKIYQEKGDDPNIRYDDTVYYVDVYSVFEDGDIKCYFVFLEEGKVTKPTRVMFSNEVINESPSPTISPTPKASNTPKPKSSKKPNPKKTPTKTKTPGDNGGSGNNGNGNNSGNNDNGNNSGNNSGTSLKTGDLGIVFPIMLIILSTIGLIITTCIKNNKLNKKKI